MNDLNIFILGAGFSVPAKLPVQNGIIKEIIKPLYGESFNDFEDKTSIKFLKAYINIGDYLLSMYSKNGNKIIEKEIKLLLNENKEEYGKRELYKQLSLTAEKIRKELERIKVDISLEDIFTSFDKSFLEKEYINNYSYFKANEINNSVKKLFSYYFSKSIQKYKFDCVDYNYFIKRLKKLKNVSIITTNWDVLLEEYFKKKNIEYDLCLNEKFYFYENENIKNSTKVDLIKLHGSINWYKCNNCGKMIIRDESNCSNFLFNDDDKERCFVCNQVEKDIDLLESEIIAPTMLKSLRSQTYLNLWSAAKSRLLNAKQVTFIGYSLPIADFDLRYMLRNSIPTNAIINVLLTKNDKPNKYNDWLMPEKRYRELFPKNKIIFDYSGFGNYFHR